MLAALLIGGGLAAPAGAAVWPGGAKAAIVLTYDDALASQLANAVPALDRHGFKATFFLSAVKQRDVAGWQTVAAHGHELANHTIFHPCAAGKIVTEARYTAEAYTPAGILREIAQQNSLLTALDGRDRHGFATPCGETVVGGVDYIEPLRASRLVTYVRGVSETAADLRTDPAAFDPMKLPARGFGEGTTLADLVAFAEAAEAGGGMAVYLFHGIGGDNLTVSDAVHRQFLDWLAAHRREVWVTTMEAALARAHSVKR